MAAEQRGTPARRKRARVTAKSQHEPRVSIVLLLCVVPAVSGRSQGKQDDILTRIFDAVGTSNKFFVEFGFNANSYEEGSGANSEALYHAGWRGLLLDGRRSNKTINLHTAYIKSTTIVEKLTKHRVPSDLDFLSVDIDSADLWVLKAILGAFTPRVVQIEFNHNFEVEGPLGAAITLPDPSTMPILNNRASWNRTCYLGASAKALMLAAAERRYKLVAVEPVLDLFFVRHDVYAHWRKRYGTGAGLPQQNLQQQLDASGRAGGGGGSLIGSFKKSKLSTAAAVAGPPEPAASSLGPELSAQLAALNTRHFPMTSEEAVNLMDYEVYRRTGSLCQARAAANKLLRAYATAYHKEFQAHENKRGWARQCFKHLRHLQLAPCDDAETRAGAGVGTDQLGHMVG